MDLQLKNKIVVITGSDSGIGKAAAFEFAQEGAIPVIIARNQEKVSQTVSEMNHLGYPCESFAADVTDFSAISSAADTVWNKYKHIDVWINNAGIAINHDFTDFTEEEYDLIMNVDLKAVFFCSQIAAKYMKQQKSGVILNASSYAALIPHANGSVYAAAKSGVSSLTRTMAACLAPYGIRVMSYIPGMIASNMSSDFIHENHEKFVRDISMHRIGVPEDLAKPIVFLASDASRYMDGFDVQITGGKFAVQDCSMSWKWLDKDSENKP